MEKRTRSISRTIKAPYSSAPLKCPKALISACEEIKKGHLDPEEITDDIFKKHLCTADFPDPELMIRTSGEYRISNFLLYQLAYSELYFTDTLWPDFRKENLYEALLNYQNRERRFGKISEQL
jgi:undecaprenyl diphosphate synthase